MHLQFKSELGIIELVTIDINDDDQLRQITPTSHLFVRRNMLKTLMLMNFTNDLACGGELYLYFDKNNYNWEVTLDGQKIDYDDDYLKSLGFVNNGGVNLGDITIDIVWNESNKDIKKLYIFMKDKQTFAKYTPSEKVMKDKRFVTAQTIVNLQQLKDIDSILY